MHTTIRDTRWPFLVVFALLSGAACNAPEEKTNPSTGVSAPLELTQTAPLRLFVSDAQPGIGLDARLLRAEGGIPPYTFTILEGPGRIESSLFSSEIAGTTTIRLADSAGHVADAVVVTKGAVLLQASRKNVSAGPHVQNQVTLAYSGGEGPISLAIDSGPGQLSGDIFIPPVSLTENAKTIITAMDSQGRRAQVEISVSKTITLNASKIALTRGYSTQNYSDLSVEGGVPPYTYALSSNFGALQDATVNSMNVKRYVPPVQTATVAGTVDVIVTDSLHNQALASLTVNPSIQFDLEATNTAAGANPNYRITLNDRGGTPPLSLSLLNPALGSIVGNEFVPPANLSGSTVQQTIVVQDANGVSASRTLVISPNFSVLAAETVCYAGKSHSQRNVKYTLAAGTLPYSRAGDPSIGSLVQSGNEFVFTPPALLSQDTPVTLGFVDGSGTRIDSPLTVTKSISFDPIPGTVYGGAAPFNLLPVSASGGTPALNWSWRWEGATLWQTTSFVNGKFVPDFPGVVSPYDQIIDLRAADALGDERIQSLKVLVGATAKVPFAYVSGTNINNMTMDTAGPKDGYFYAARRGGSAQQYCLEVFKDSGRYALPIKTICPTNMAVAQVAVRSDGDYVYFAGEAGTTIPAVDIKVGRMKPDGTLDSTYDVTLATSSTDRLAALETDSQGNVYVYGYTFGNFPGYSSTDPAKAFMAKLDATGKQIWLNQGLGIFCDRLVKNGAFLYGLCRPDGGYGQIVRFDDQGKILNSIPNFNRLGDLTVDPTDGSVYALNSAYPSSGGYQTTVLSYDSHLVPQWSKVLASRDPIGSAHGIGVTVSGDRIYVGLMVSGEFLGTPIGDGSDIALVALDKAGNPAWARRTGIAGRGDFPEHMLLMPSAEGDDVYIFGQNFYSYERILELYGFTIFN